MTLERLKVFWKKKYIYINIYIYIYFFLNPFEIIHKLTQSFIFLKKILFLDIYTLKNF